jgi:hypothetical protein
MSVDPNRLKLEQLRRVLQSMGWEVVVEDLSGPRIKVVVEAPKHESQTPR